MHPQYSQHTAPRSTPSVESPIRPGPARAPAVAQELARVRHAQLDLARAGRVIESARAAARAVVLRGALAGALTAGIAVPAAVTPAAAQPASAVRTAEVTRETVQEHRRVTGSLQAVSRAAVATQEPGLVTEILVDEGSVVEPGQIIARLDDRRIHAQIEELRAEHAAAKALLEQRTVELRFAEHDLGRIRSAHDRAAASDRELSETETAVGVRRSQAEAARRAGEQVARRIELLEIRLADTVIRAPFAASVVQRHTEPGEWLDAGQPVVTLVSTGPIEARLEVPERYAAALARDAGNLFVEVASDGRTVPTIDARVVMDVDPRARTFSVFVTLDNKAGELAPGMSINAWIPTTESAEALLIPRDAVIRDGRSAFVYRVADAAAERAPVRVLFSWGDRLAVESASLAAGDTVVIEGNERLAPGAALAVAAPAAPAPRPDPATPN